MKRTRMRVFSMLLALLMLLSLLPVSAFAVEPGNEPEEAYVAKIGDVGYATLDAAVEAAADGATIELLSDCTLTKQFTKGLTFTGKGKITFETGRWDYTAEKTLTFDGSGVVFDFTSTANEWLQMCLGGTLNVKNGATVIFRFDSKFISGSTPNCAIYMNSGSAINVENGSLFQIFGQNTMGVIGQGIQLDSPGTANITVKGESTFLIDGTNRGYVASPVIYVENSTFNIRNCTNNASNGGQFTAINSTINYLNNRGHGLSTSNATIENSVMKLMDNGYCGFANTGELSIDGNSEVYITGNGWNNLTGQAALRQGGNGVVKTGAILYVYDNYCTGIYVNKTTGNLTIESGVDLDVVCNGKLTESGNRLTTTGGGIWNVGTMAIPADVVLYNNHAGTAGDDIYNTGTITFGEVGSDWYLDGEPDCTDKIDGWYLDGGAYSRWEAHEKPIFAYEYTEFADGTSTVAGEIALKAAHGLIPVDSTTDWDISKSKTATNLNSSYESDVTLSLPAAEDNLVSDVVFVLDESSCSEPVKKEVAEMLDALYTQVSDTNATIKIGAVQFRGEVTELPLTELTESTKDTVTQFMSTRPEVGGSNMSAGLLAGEKMLDSDTSVASDRKYLILVSDGITYIWDDETTDEQENYGVNFANADVPDAPMLASPDGWDTKHGNGYVPEDWENHMASVNTLMGVTIAERASLYERGENATVNKPFVAYSEKNNYASTVDIALYKSYEAYQRIAGKYQTYAVMAGEKDDINTFPFGPSFMSYLADGKTVTFDDIQKEIYYLLDAGSKVVDVIGSGTDDKGNAYNFDFVNDIAHLTLTVGGVELGKTEILVSDIDPEMSVGRNEYETAAYGFYDKEDETQQYQFVLHYFAKGQDGASDECFVWDINVPVTKFAPVQLTYGVKLTNPQSAAGTYGEYDADGSANKAALYTNNSATLYPVDSNGAQGQPELFNKPTVSYTVSTYIPPVTPVGPNITPALNKTDHKMYIVGYPEDYRTGEYTEDTSLWPVKPEMNITRAEVATIFFRLLEDEVRDSNLVSYNDFPDVQYGEWYNTAISTMVALDIVSGYPDGTFKPDQYITRAELATISARFSEVVYNGGNPFTDIPDDHWAAGFISLSAYLGWVSGYPDGTFKPDQYITRAETMSLINRVLDRVPETPADLHGDMHFWPDNANPDAWYYIAVQEATCSHNYVRNAPVPAETWTSLAPNPDWFKYKY